SDINKQHYVKKCKELQSLAVACCLLPVALSSQLTLLLSDYLAGIWLRNIIGTTKAEFWKLQLIQQCMIGISSHSKDRIKAVNKSSCLFLTICFLS
ncbi:MAG: hypothetical protein AB4426_09600, partial [Xenococcaceae cyanobacterium]